MEGLKQKSVFSFMNHMFVSKGTFPTEGVFFGIDNDSKGHIFMDQMTKFQFQDKEGREVLLKNLIPQDLQIPKSNIDIYKSVCSGVYSEVDWTG